MDDNGVWEYTQTNIPKPTTSYAQEIAQWNKDTTKDMRIILEVLEITWFQTCMEMRLLLQCGKISQISSKEIVIP